MSLKTRGLLPSTLGVVADLADVPVAEPSHRSVCIHRLTRRTPESARSPFPEGTLFVDVTRAGQEQPLPATRILGYQPAAVMTARRSAFPRVCNTPVLDSSDPIAATGKLGVLHRAAFAAPAVGVTGSVGKSTTTALLAHLLSQIRPVLATIENENDECDVPLRVLDLEQRHGFLVFEMATWRPGEIAFLAEIVKPTVAIVTNVGWSHYARFSSRRRIADAKGELVDALPEGGLAVLNGDDPLVRAMGSNGHCRRSVFSMMDPGADAFLASWKPQGYGSQFRAVIRGEERLFSTRLTGVHNALNAIAAVLAAVEMDLDLDLAVAGVATFCSKLTGRLTTLECSRGILVVDDAYNASPSSVDAAAQVLEDYGVGRRRVAVFGGADELGDMAGRLHAEMTSRLATAADILVLLDSERELSDLRIDGQLTMLVNSTRGSCTSDLLSLVQPGDIVLFKGSHSKDLSGLATEFAERLGFNA